MAKDGCGGFGNSKLDGLSSINDSLEDEIIRLEKELDKAINVIKEIYNNGTSLPGCDSQYIAAKYLGKEK